MAPNIDDAKTDPTKNVLDLVNAAILRQDDLRIANDQRYKERFEAQEKAVKDALVSQEKAVNAALAAAEKAVLVAEQNAEKWRSNANEWRAAMDDRENSFAQKSEVNLQVMSLKERMSSLEIARARQGGEFEGLGLGWKMFIGAAGLVLTAMTIVNIITYTSKEKEPASQVIYAPAPAPAVPPK